MVPTTSSDLSSRALIPFLAISFGLTWSIAALLILFTEPLVAMFGEIRPSNPLFILAVYSPGFAALFLVWRAHGIAGLGRLLRRLTLWRVSASWWLFLILGIPAVVYLGAAIKGSISDPLPFSPWFAAFPALALAFFLGPIEEFGWRGLALPLLQRKLAPFWAGLILGIVWAIWHIPAFLLSGTAHSTWAFVPFFVGVVAISVILTSLFNSARGSLLLAYLYHFQMMNPIWPDAQPYDEWLFVVIAIIVVWFNRADMFAREGSVTEVLPK
ncbi:MAG: CPBP family intramembrane metalloprotease [Gammaproteobacteria bacterium]|nr:CPBP family intramembrane metalloprotease [Gammaproteobacteria bacterium]